MDFYIASKFPRLHEIWDLVRKKLREALVSPKTLILSRCFRLKLPCGPCSALYYACSV